MTTKLRTEDIRGDLAMPDKITAGVIDGSKIACAGLQADRLSAAMLGGKDTKITAGQIDASRIGCDRIVANRVSQVPTE